MNLDLSCLGALHPTSVALSNIAQGEGDALSPIKIMKAIKTILWMRFRFKLLDIPNSYARELVGQGLLPPMRLQTRATLRTKIHYHGNECRPCHHDCTAIVFWEGI